MSLKYLRSGHRHELHDTKFQRDLGPRPWSKTFYPYADTSIRYFGREGSPQGVPLEGAITWDSTNFVGRADIPNADIYPSTISNFWPFKTAQEVQDFQDAGGDCATLFETTEFLLGSDSGYFPWIEAQGWMSFEIQNEDLLMPSQIWEHYPHFSPSRSVMFFDIPKSVIETDESGTNINGANLKFWIHKQTPWPGDVSCEIFLAEPQTGKWCDWTHRSGAGPQNNEPTGQGGDRWSETTRLPNPVHEEIPYHGLPGEEGGGSVMKLTSDQEYVVPLDGVSFIIPDLSSHDFQREGPVELSVNVRDLVNYALRNMPEETDPDGKDLPGKIKFIMRVSYWPCCNDDILVTPSPSIAPSLCPTVTPDDGDDGDVDDGTKGGGAGMPEGMPEGGNGSMGTPLSMTRFSMPTGTSYNSNRYGVSIGGPATIGKTTPNNTGQNLINKAYDGHSDTRYITNVITTLSQDPSYGGPRTNNPDAPFGGRVDQSKQAGDGTKVTEKVTPGFTFGQSGIKFSPSDTGPPPTGPTPTPTSPDITPSDHPEPSPSDIDPSPTADIPCTYPSDWCINNGGGWWGESRLGYNEEWDKEKLYATYILSREYHDYGEHPNPLYGTLSNPVPGVEFALTKPTSATFPDIYYDTIGNHHGLRTLTPRGQKLVDGPYDHKPNGDFGMTHERVYGLPQAWVILPGPNQSATARSTIYFAFIDTPDFDIAHGLNLEPGDDGVNIGATFEIKEDFEVEGPDGTVVNLKGTHTLKDAGSGPVFDVNISPAMLPTEFPDTASQRRIVIVALDNPEEKYGFRSSTNTYYPVCEWRTSAEHDLEHPSQPASYGATTHRRFDNNLSSATFHKGLYQVNTESREGVPGFERYLDLITGSDDPTSSMFGTDQKFKVEVTNTNDGARMADGDSIIITAMDEVDGYLYDPALAWTLGDTIAIDYGFSQSVGNPIPNFGFIDGVTDTDTNNQGVYTFEWYTLDSEGRRVVGVKDGDVTVAETRTITNPVRMKRINYAPTLEVSWESATAPEYDAYLDGIIG